MREKKRIQKGSIQKIWQGLPREAQNWWKSRKLEHRRNFLTKTGSEMLEKYWNDDEKREGRWERKKGWSDNKRERRNIKGNI